MNCLFSDHSIVYPFLSYYLHALILLCSFFSRQMVLSLFSVPQLLLLCSASRDRMIHIFDPNKEYSRVQTISDHSGAIFSAKIIETDDGEIRLISCGMDKSLLFRILEVSVLIYLCIIVVKCNYIKMSK